MSKKKALFMKVVAPSAPSEILRKGEASSAGSGTSQVTGTFDCTDADCILVWVTTNLGTQAVTSVTDTEGNSYIEVGARIVDTFTVSGHWWIATGITTATDLNVTANFDGSTVVCTVHAVGYSDVNQTTPTTQLNSDGGDPLEITNTPLNNADSHIMGWIARQGTEPTLGTGQTLISTESPVQTIAGISEELAAGISANTQSADIGGSPSAGAGQAFVLQVAI